MNDHPRLLVCRCAQAQTIPQGIGEAVLAQIEQSGVVCEVVDDLCKLAARRDPLLQRFAHGGGLTVAACQPRAVQWLFAAAGAPLSADTTTYVNLRNGGIEALCAALPMAIEAGTSAESGARQPSKPEPSETDGWSAWFPIIDYDRCTGCMQCLSFCLFGVYGVDEQTRIQVIAPDQCKANCPACSRVCPEAAILFPKHHSGAINGGEIGVSREAMKVDVSALLGGDLYATLRERNAHAGLAKRFSVERDPATALQERRRHLAALAQAGEIPPEVLMSLPSADEIARRSAEAKAKGKAALEKKLQREGDVQK